MGSDVEKVQLEGPTRSLSTSGPVAILLESARPSAWIAPDQSDLALYERRETYNRTRGRC
jgi:hypothetical protein